MTQAQTTQKIKQTFKNKYPELYKYIRFIPIHGSRYQEAGLPDLMILVPLYRNYWLEIKRTWRDKPTQLQLYNLINLTDFAFTTGIVVGDEYKRNWEDSSSKKLIDVI